MNKKIISMLMMVCMLMTLLCGCSSKSAAGTMTANKKITVKDMLGREITINGIPKKVVATKGALRLYCYVGSPDKIVGVEQIEKKSPAGRPYMLANPKLAELPVVGQGGANNSDDYEKILAVKPDVIITTAKDKASADNLQSKTEIPVIVVSYGKTTVFDSEVYDSLKLIGKVVGEDKRAEEAVGYMEKCKKDLEDRTKDIPEGKRPSAYVGGLGHCGPHGVESTSGNYALFNAVHAKNVVDDTGKKGIVMVDKEKLIQWNPDKIILDLGGLQLVQEDYKKNPDFYKTLAAFKNGEVYSQLPYNYYWTNIEVAMSDAYYIGKVLYPEQFKDVNPEKKADEIYKMLVGKEIYSQMAKDYGGFKKITLE